MDQIVTFLICVALIYAVALVSIALYLVRWLEPLPHERYGGFHVYAVDADGNRWHVKRELLELYRDIKSTQIIEIQGPSPNAPREIKLWTVTFGLPSLFAPLIRLVRGK